MVSKLGTALRFAAKIADTEDGQRSLIASHPNALKKVSSAIVSLTRAGFSDNKTKEKVREALRDLYREANKISVSNEATERQLKEAGISKLLSLPQELLTENSRLALSSPPTRIDKIFNHIYKYV